MRGRASLQDLILKLPLLFLFVLLQWSFGHAQTIKSQKATFKLKVVTSGLNHPWSMALSNPWDQEKPPMGSEGLVSCSSCNN